MSVQNGVKGKYRMIKYKIKTRDCQLQIRAKLSFKEKVDEKQLNFFCGKNIRGLLKTREKKRNLIEFYGPIGISLYERLKKPVTKYDFLFIMEQIVDIVQKIKLNSLNIGNVVFDVHYVFINETTRELQFLYLPLENRTREADVMAFIEQIIYASKPLPENDMEYISRFVYFMKAVSAFDADKTEKYIMEEDRSIVNTVKRHNVGQSGFMTDKQAAYYAHYAGHDAGEKTGVLVEETELLDEEATGILDMDEEATGLLNGQQERIRYASLYRQLTQETILLNKPVFRIGKERSYSDYFVSNNDKVSRSHADIIARGNRFFIVDLNSKNRTFVNGVPIPVQQEMEIYDGDRIRLANEEFEFRT